MEIKTKLYIRMACLTIVHNYKVFRLVLEYPFDDNTSKVFKSPIRMKHAFLNCVGSAVIL